MLNNSCFPDLTVIRFWIVNSYFLLENTTKIAIKKDDDSPNEDEFIPQMHKGKSSSTKPFSMGAQPNKYAGQLLLNPQRSNPMPMPFPNHYAQVQPPQSLFDNTYDYQEPVNNGKLMKDVANTPKKSQIQNNFMNKAAQNVYNPSLYQNGNPSYNNYLQQQSHNPQRGQNGKENIANLEYMSNQQGNMFFNQNTPLQVNMQQVSDQIKDISNIKIRNEEDLLALNQRHQQLINVILGEEEEIISIHRQHIDDIVDCVKQVTTFLSSFS